MMELLAVSLQQVLSQFWVYGAGFISGAIVPWYVKRKIATRDAQREWYGDVARVARRARDAWTYELDDILIDANTLDEMRDAAEVANELLDHPPNVDGEVLNDLEALYDRMSEFNGHSFFQEDDDDFWMVEEYEEGTEPYEVQELVEGIRRVSERLADEADEKSGFGWDVFGVRI